MNLKVFATVLFAASLISANASGAEVIKLWPNGAPNKSTITEPETVNDKGSIFNVTEARMEVSIPENPTGRGIIVMPGGGYSNLSMGVIDKSYVPFFLKQGFTVFTLKYRMPKGDPMVPLADARESVRLVKSMAGKYNLHTVGVFGASAGGHLAGMASVFYDKDSKPDFTVLIYPNISMMREHTLNRKGCRTNLLGEDVRNIKYDAYLSLQNRVTTETPPAFIGVSAHDQFAGSLGSILYTQAMIANGRPVSLHIYPTGNHGWGLEKSEAFPDADKCRADLEMWLKDIK